MGLDRLWHEPQEKQRLHERLVRIARRRPGALTATFLARAHERWKGRAAKNVDELLSVSLEMYVSTKFPSRQPRELNEAQTLSQVMQHLLDGEVANAMDVLSGRFIALETAASQKGDWKRAMDWELRNDISSTLAGT